MSAAETRMKLFLCSNRKIIKRDKAYQRHLLLSVISNVGLLNVLVITTNLSQHSSRLKSCQRKCLPVEIIQNFTTIRKALFHCDFVPSLISCTSQNIRTDLHNFYKLFDF